MPHLHEKIDFTVSVYVVCKNKVLLRKHEKYGGWFGPGGHIELDENPVEAVLRETKEEVGLDIKLIPPHPIPNSKDEGRELIPPWFMNIHYINETHQHNDLIYIAVSETDKVVPEKEGDEWRWLTLEEIEKNNLECEGRVRFYALEALKAANNL